MIKEINLKNFDSELENFKILGVSNDKGKYIYENAETNQLVIY